MVAQESLVLFVRHLVSGDIITSCYDNTEAIFLHSIIPDICHCSCVIWQPCMREGEQVYQSQGGRVDLQVEDSHFHLSILHIDRKT